MLNQVASIEEHSTASDFTISINSPYPDQCIGVSVSTVLFYASYWIVFLIGLSGHPIPETCQTSLHTGEKEHST
jgi:hypothetical protein